VKQKSRWVLAWWPYALSIHSSAWKVNSANFALTEFYEAHRLMMSATYGWR
jgi:hypothetical protein